MVSLFSKHKYFLYITCSYFIIRLINLTSIPIFNDEAIYLDWGWREIHKGIPFYSLLDAKQPLLLWIFGITETLFSDQLFAGRIISVIAGFFSLFGIYRLGKELYSQKIAIVASILYIIIPVFSFFDRQSLMESAVSTAGIWIVYLFTKLLQKHAIKNAVILGCIIGISFFIKSTILLFVIAILVSYLIYIKLHQKNKSFVLDILIAVITSQIVLLPLYVQSQFWQTLGTNNRYSLGFIELIRFPFTTWAANIWAVLQVSFWQLTPLVFLSLIVGSILIIRVGNKAQRFILLIFITQIVFLILIAKGINTRYVSPFLPLSVLIVSYLITYFSKWSKVLFISLAIIPIYFLSLQLFRPETYFTQLKRVTTYSQSEEYVQNSTAGYAVTEAVQYLKNNHDSLSVIAVRLDTGNPENAIYTYFHKDTMRVPSFLESRMIANVSHYQCLTYKVPVYFVSRDFALGGLDTYLQEEKRFYNPENRSSVGIYTFKTSCRGNTLDLSTPGAILQPSSK